MDQDIVEPERTRLTEQLNHEIRQFISEKESLDQLRRIGNSSCDMGQGIDELIRLVRIQAREAEQSRLLLERICAKL